MRILIYGLNYYPELTGIGKYTGEMAAWLASKDYELKVITAPPYYPEWKIRPGYNGGWYRKENQTENIKSLGSSSPLSNGNNCIKVWRCPVWVPRRVTAIRRIIHLLSFMAASFPVMLAQIFWRPSVVFVVEPTKLCAPSALIVARLCGARAWLHIQDFEIPAAVSLGMVKNRLLQRILLWLDKTITRRFDRVSTISEKMLERLAASEMQKEKLVYFPNWVDAKAIYPLDTPSPMRREIQIDDGTVVVQYAGNIGEKQGLEILVEAATKLEKYSNIKFVICGEGAAKNRLVEQSKSVNNIIWLPVQPVEKLNELLNLADIHILPQLEGAEDLVLPSKMGNMLASARPIIAMANWDAQVARIVGETGEVVPPGDLSALVEAILDLVENKDKCKLHGKVGREYVEQHLSREKILTALEADIQNCVMQKG